MYRLTLVPTLAAVVGGLLVFSSATAEEHAEEATLPAILDELREMRQELRELRGEAAPPARTEQADEEAAGEWFPTLQPRTEAVVITPLRRYSEARNSPSRVEVIDEADMRRRGYPVRVQDQLQGRPGVYLTSNGSYGGLTSLRLRGTRSFDTRILQDGLPVLDPSTTQGQMDLSRLSTVGVERTEILFGAQSGLYGSQAIGGVVDVRTARPTAQQRSSVRLEGGSMNTYTADAVVTGPLGESFGYAVSLRGVSSDGMSATYRAADYDNLIPGPGFATTPYTQALEIERQWARNFRYNPESNNPIPFDLRADEVPLGNPNNHEKDGFRQGTLRGRVEWYASEQLTVYAAAEGVVGRNQFDGFNTPDDRDSRDRSQDLRYSAGAEMQVHDDITLWLDGLWSDSSRELPHEDSLVGQDRNFAGQVAYASLRGQWQINDLVSWDAGLDVERQAVSLGKGSGVNDIADALDLAANGRWGFAWPSTPPALQQIRNELDPFGMNPVYDALVHWLNMQPRDENVYQAGLWSGLTLTGDDYVLNATVRHDRHQREGDATSFRVGGSWWAWDERLRFHGSVGTGFRAPSLFELYSTWGNEDLHAERSVSYDAGVEFRPRSWISLGATWYRTDYRERIDFDFSQGYINSGSDARVSGVELRLTLDPDDRPWRLSAYYNPQRSSETTAPGIRQSLLRTPDRLAGVEGTWDFQTAWITLGVRQVGARREFGSDNVGGIPIPTMAKAYQVVYGAAGWSPRPGWEIYVRGENLADEDYEDVPGFTTLRPAAWLGVNATF